MQFTVIVSRALILSTSLTVEAENEEDASATAYELVVASELTWHTPDNYWEQDADIIDIESVDENTGECDENGGEDARPR